MNRQLITIVKSEIQSLIREKTVVLLFVVFFLMAFFSASIGWATKATVLSMYEESVHVLALSGLTHPPVNPFLIIPHLALFHNLIIYVFLIGALLSIVIGYTSFIRERKSGATKLILSRPITRVRFVSGKIIGTSITLGIIMMLLFCISVISTYFIPSQALTPPEITNLALFYLLSTAYMILFSMLGMSGALFAKTESLALLLPIIIWVAITFIFPELTTGQNPVALLNPTNISQSTVQGLFFTTTRNVLMPFSVEQFYTSVATAILDALPSFPIQSLMALLTYLIASIGSVYYVASIYRPTEDTLYD